MKLHPLRICASLCLPLVLEGMQYHYSSCTYPAIPYCNFLHFLSTVYVSFYLQGKHLHHNKQFWHLTRLKQQNCLFTYKTHNTTFNSAQSGNKANLKSRTSLKITTHSEFKSPKSANLGSPTVYLKGKNLFFFFLNQNSDPEKGS